MLQASLAEEQHWALTARALCRIHGHNADLLVSLAQRSRVAVGAFWGAAVTTWSRTLVRSPEDSSMAIDDVLQPPHDSRKRSLYEVRRPPSLGCIDGRIRPFLQFFALATNSDGGT